MKPSVPVSLYYENTLLEGLVEEFKLDFPNSEIEIKLEQGHSAEMQVGVAHEFVRIILDPALLASLLGIVKVGFLGSLDFETGKRTVKRKPCNRFTAPVGRFQTFLDSPSRTNDKL